VCLVIVSPYLIWETANHWPTLEYWQTYGTFRVFKASLPQYFINIMAFMNPWLLPLYLAGLYRLFRRLNGVNYGFLGVLFLFTLALLFFLHASMRMLCVVFMPLIAAGAVFTEELLSGARWRIGLRAVPSAYLLAAGLFVMPSFLPILPIESVTNLPGSVKFWYQSVREMNAGNSYAPVTLAGRVGWEALARDVADVYDQLPAEERAVAGIFTDWYYTAAAIDYYGPRYGLPHAVSGSLTYYLWGPGYSWDEMLIVTTRVNILSVYFDSCEQKAIAGPDAPGPYRIFVCKGPKLAPEAIWPHLKNYH
jgi:hypothetical protein